MQSFKKKTRQNIVFVFHCERISHMLVKTGAQISIA